MTCIIETERLILRLFTLDDATITYRLHTDPENMRFMNRLPDSVEFERYHLQRHITNYYEGHGFGLWAVVLKENNELIGRCGFLYQPVEGEEVVEVSYLIDRPYWGRGLATEAVGETLRLGFERYKFPQIVAIIDPKNVASVRVAEKVGMKYERDVDYKDYGQVAMYAQTEREFAERVGLQHSGSGGV